MQKCKKQIDPSPLVKISKVFRHLEGQYRFIDSIKVSICRDKNSKRISKNKNRKTKKALKFQIKKCSPVYLTRASNTVDLGEITGIFGREEAEKVPNTIASRKKCCHQKIFCTYTKLKAVKAVAFMRITENFAERRRSNSGWFCLNWSENCQKPPKVVINVAKPFQINY